MHQAQPLPMQRQYSYTQQPAASVAPIQPLLNQQASSTSFSATARPQQQVGSFYQARQPNNFMMQQQSFSSYQAPQEPALPEYKRMDTQSSLGMGAQQQIWQQQHEEYAHSLTSEMQQKLQLSSKKHSAAKEDIKKANPFLMKNNQNEFKN
jgi:hypothetical protein